MAGADWMVLAAGLGGTALGSALQWAQSAFHARRERIREERAWSREDRRLWAEKRQAVYQDGLSVAQRQIWSLDFPHRLSALGLSAEFARPEGKWRRAPDVVGSWNQRLAEVEFYGSDEVRAAITKLAETLNVLEDVATGEDLYVALSSLAKETYADCVSLMRRDLGLSDGSLVDRDEIARTLGEVLSRVSRARESLGDREGQPKDRPE
ncbi:hypothetical protein [Micromonospora sp. WMMD1082]|uniref:hypothetical protein n=1 Tax=Micromonospora sp. WMMD1082 TaxID=3016104 RepID=UPI0024164C8D|nr:hypothetical protein [Micromonospora sp. WMMD1082]MDG4796910.1 hypothetical protein [Micromonospora sp. WMMD1082]